MYDGALRQNYIATAEIAVPLHKTGISNCDIRDAGEASVGQGHLQWVTGKVYLPRTRRHDYLHYSKISGPFCGYQMSGKMFGSPVLNRRFHAIALVNIFVKRQNSGANKGKLNF